MLKKEEFSLIEYARHIKMQESLDAFKEGYWHRFVKKKGYIDIRNFTEHENSFSKVLPMNHNNGYLEVFKSKESYERSLRELKTKIIALQIILLLLFAFISYMMAISALRPLQKSIEMLDKFAKDLIHDLNTPVTSMKLNLNLLKRERCLENNKALQRLDKSVYGISELYENLTILLEEETFMLERMDLCEVIRELTETYRVIYPNLRFETECKNFNVRSNAAAIKQVLQNIISNACKYNRDNGTVRVYTKGNALYIQDSGKGIAEPDKIFKRHYSGGHSSGIGLDIVQRLATAMGLRIEVQSDKNGTTFILHF